MTVRAVIFDFGGVLARTEDRIPRTALAERFGLTYEELEAIVYGGETSLQASRGEIPVKEHWQAVCDHLEFPPTEIRAFQREFWGGDVIDEKLIDYIRSLPPRFKVGLLSNAWSDMRKSLQEEWDILKLFDVVIISAEVGLIKPDPRIYQLAVEKLGVQPEEAVFVDDMRRNVEAAREAGLHAIRFTNRQEILDQLKTLLDGD